MERGRFFNNNNMPRRWHPKSGMLPLLNAPNFIEYGPRFAFQLANNRGLNYNQQIAGPSMNGWIPANGPQGLRLPYQPRMPFTNPGYQPHNQNQRRQPPKRKNQFNDEPTSSYDKKARIDGGNDSDVPISCKDKFIVPIKRGTEKITMAIWDSFLSSQMTEEDLKKKLLLRKSLLSILEDAFPKCRLFIVGSSMTGFATRNSDVDMCFMISDDDVHQKREAPLILTLICKALRQCSFVQWPQVIRAKVPILKFKDRISGVECDLNINNTIGIRNTHLLRSYAYMDWRVRPLMLFIKRWARFHDINDASKKTISSYSFSLMLIHFLQAGVSPPVLPCLQAMKPDLFSGDHDVRGLYLALDKIDFKSKNDATLGELFLGFLHYYSTVFRYDNDLISVRTGRRLKRYEAEGDSTQWKNLCIEEPFECSNTARSVYDTFVFQRIRRVFLLSFQRLSKHKDCEAILVNPF